MAIVTVLYWFVGLLCGIGSINWGLERFVGIDLVVLIKRKTRQRGIDYLLYLAIGIAGALQVLMPAHIINLISGIGALNWGIYAHFSFNLVDYLAVQTKVHNIDKLFYVLISVCGMMQIFLLF